MNFANRVFLDTNVLIYDIFYRHKILKSPYLDDVGNLGLHSHSALGYLMALNKTTCYIASFSVVQVLSTLSRTKEIPKNVVKGEIESIVGRFEIVDFTKKDILSALSLGTKDLEDGFQYALGQKTKCFYIVTNNVKDFSQFQDVRILKPKNIRLIQPY